MIYYNGKVFFGDIMELNQKLINEILSRKKRGSKSEKLMEYRELVFKLHSFGLSLQDICAYLKQEYKLKVSPITLKNAFPELIKRLDQFEKIVKNMTNEELKKAYKIMREELAKRGMLKKSSMDSSTNG